MEKAEDLLIDKDEKIVATLGMGIIRGIVNDLMGEEYVRNRRGLSVLTDKRVYFKGKCYEKQNRRWKRVSTEKIVDIKDVTGSGFTHTWDLHRLVITIILSAFLLLSIYAYTSFESYWNNNVMLSGETDQLGPLIAFVIVVLSISVMVNFIVFLARRIILFEISFAGGSLSFNSAWFPTQEAKAFQKELRAAKDNYCKANSAINLNIRQPNNDTKADKIGQLKELNELLRSGAISAEEFYKLKSEVLS